MAGMSKQSMVGWFVLAGAFALMIAVKALGVDGNAQTAIDAMFALGFSFIGLSGWKGGLNTNGGVK